VRDSNAQQLRRAFADIEFKEGESVDEFSLQITTQANNLRTLGDEVTEAEVVKKLLQVVPDSLEQAAVATEILLDLNTTSVEEVTAGYASSSTVVRRRSRLRRPWGNCCSLRMSGGPGIR
jgi:hypothetical protein